MKKMIMAATLALALAPLGMPAFANHDGHDCWHDGGKKDHKADMTEFQDKIGMSAEQRAQSEANWKSTEAEVQPLKDQLMAQKKDLMQYLSAPGATESGALAKQQEINRLHAQIDDAKLKGMFKTKALLTPEQQQKAAALMQTKMAEHDKWHHHHKDHGWKKHSSQSQEDGQIITPTQERP